MSSKHSETLQTPNPLPSARKQADPSVPFLIKNGGEIQPKQCIQEWNYKEVKCECHLKFFKNEELSLSGFSEVQTGFQALLSQPYQTDKQDPKHKTRNIPVDSLEQFHSYGIPTRFQSAHASNSAKLKNTALQNRRLLTQQKQSSYTSEPSRTSTTALGHVLPLKFCRHNERFQIHMLHSQTNRSSSELIRTDPNTDGRQRKHTKQIQKLSQVKVHLEKLFRKKHF